MAVCLDCFGCCTRCRDDDNYSTNDHDNNDIISIENEGE